MCIISNTSSILKAKTTKYCYKVVFNIAASWYITPFIKTPISKEIILGKAPFVAEGRISKFWNEIYSGVIHTYTRKKDAKKAAHALQVDLNWATAEVYRCKIRKGVRYYAGTNYNGKPVYGSKEIMFMYKVQI